VIERLSGRRHVGDWSYVVRRVGDRAIEVGVARSSGGLRVCEAMLHQRIEPDEYATVLALGAGGVREVCELVDGRCIWESRFLDVLPVFEEHALQYGPHGATFEQPEAFWLALEALL